MPGRRGRARAVPVERYSIDNVLHPRRTRFRLTPTFLPTRAAPALPRARSRPRLPKGLVAWLGLPWSARLRWLGRKLGELLRGGGRIRSADRAVLEGTLLPTLAADPRLRSLVFVGCGPYTRHYATLFAPATERFRTMDIDPRRARHGHTGHVVAAVQDIAAHFPAESVDAIVCNGVYGFGLDDRAELEAALHASAAVLRPGGRFVLGWNDVPAFAPFDPAEVALAAGLVGESALLGRWRLVTDTPTRHTFDSYVKPAAPARRPRGALRRDAASAPEASDAASRPGVNRAGAAASVPAAASSAAGRRPRARAQRGARGRRRAAAASAGSRR